MGGSEVALSRDPVPLGRGSGLQPRALAEPLVEFGRHQETSNIRDGITQFGTKKSASGMPSGKTQGTTPHFDAEISPTLLLRSCGKADLLLCTALWNVRPGFSSVGTKNIVIRLAINWRARVP